MTAHYTEGKPDSDEPWLALTHRNMGDDVCDCGSYGFPDTGGPPMRRSEERRLLRVVYAGIAAAVCAVLLMWWPA